jgi:hypothetical protein
MHKQELYQNMLKEIRDFIICDRLFLMQLYSYYHSRVKAYNKNIISYISSHLVPHSIIPQHHNNPCTTLKKQNSNIYTPILVYYVTKRMVYLLSKVQNLGRYAQSYTLFISISFQLHSHALSYQLR